MRLSQLLPASIVVCVLSVAGCGGSNEPSSVDSGELQSYVQDNAAALAAEDAAMEMEDANEDEDE